MAVKNQSVASSFIQDIPLNHDNEFIIIANAVKNLELRRIFLRRLTYTNFRVDQSRAIAWAIAELDKAGLEVTADSIAIQVNSSPVKPAPVFDDINNIICNFPDVGTKEFEELYITRLIEDQTRVFLLKDVFDKILKGIVDYAVPLATVKENYQSGVRKIENSGIKYKCNFQTVAEMVPSYIADKEKARSFRTTGFPSFDKLLGEGLKEKTVTIICGRSSMGKSSFLLSMFNQLAHIGIPTGLFSLEMHNQAILSKLLSYDSNIALSAVTQPFPSMDETMHSLVRYELERLKKNQCMYIQDKPQSLKEARDQICLLQDKLQIEYIPIAFDLFGKLSDFRGSDNFARDYENKLNEVQDMAKELCIPVILVCQLNRETMKRKNTRPTMIDLKNAGALEEAADLIIGLHRPGYNPEGAMKRREKENSLQRMMQEAVAISSEEDEYDVKQHYVKELNETTAMDYLAEVHIMKQRMGANNIFDYFMFDLKTTAYREMSPDFAELISIAAPLADESYGI
jgi:replicative DNA helicase